MGTEATFIYNLWIFSYLINFHQKADGYHLGLHWPCHIFGARHL